VQRVVVASSDKAYGESESLPYTEDSPLAARHPYAASKACADVIAQSYHETCGLPVAIARCGNVYGGGDLNWSRIVPGTVRALLHGDPPLIRSDGTFVRDYVYVKDVSRAYMELAGHIGEPGVAGEAFNFSDERPLGVLELVAEIAHLLGREDLTPVVLDYASGEIRSQSLSARKARERLGWLARYDLESGLAETIEWYRDFFFAVDKAPVESARE
jgi:CDP-glucose 4,6-dehydratase